MDWKHFIKPNKWKIIISIVFTFVWIIVLNVITPIVLCKCVLGGFENCVDYYSFLVLKEGFCHCNCISLTEVFMQYLWVIIVPFVVIYLLYSLVEMIISKRKK